LLSVLSWLLTVLPTGSLKTLPTLTRVYLFQLFGSSGRRKTWVQNIAFLFVVHGIHMIYPPAAWIFAGLAIFAALEVR